MYIYIYICIIIASWSAVSSGIVSSIFLEYMMLTSPVEGLALPGEPGLAGEPGGLGDAALSSGDAAIIMRIRRIMMITTIIRNTIIIITIIITTIMNNSTK